ncbi:MAG: hypothetical protein HC822_18030 [Oscillochloris sp.]|nr:hypothetical protein [Oscillochloris sp.]
MSAELTRPHRAARGALSLNVARADRWLVALWIALLLLVTAIPYWYAERRAAASGMHFNGVLINIPDNMQYWSWMRDHRDALVIPNRLTSEPNDPALFNLLWLMLGRIEQATGMSEAAIYQVLRVAGSGAFLVALWWFLGLIVPRRNERWAGFALISLGGGLGWIWVIDKYLNGLSDLRMPFHLYVSEPNTFFNVLAFPHFLAAAALILAVFGCFLKAERGDGRIWYAVATAAALFLGVQHAYDLIMIYAILGIYTLLRFAQAGRIRWDLFWGLGAVGLLSFPPAGYFVYITTQNPLWREVLDQFSNAGVFTPSPFGLLILLGLPFIISLIYGAILLRRGAWRAARHADASPAATFIWVWAIVGFALLYIPADFQIHMLNPYQIPLGILAIWALRELAGRVPWKLAGRKVGFTTLAGLLLVLCLPTTAYLWTWQMLDMRATERPFFIQADEVAALEWLEQRDSERAVVLAGLELGQFVPAYTSHRSVLAHWAMTAHFYERRDDVQRFFDGATGADERRRLLAELGVQYVLYGSEERALGNYNPAGDVLLEPVFDTPTVQIFAVTGSGD